MRRKKHKQTRRATNYYRINYGFHEPYKVLLDGNFIHATKAINMGDLATHLPKLLGGACKLYTTKCVTRELRSMGAEFAASAAAARAFPLHKCEHGGGHGHDHDHNSDGGKRKGKGEPAADVDEEEEQHEVAKSAKGGGGGGSVPAAECIRAAIGKKNEGHWFVATQDAALRQELGKIPGCPLVFATVNGVHLETPTEVSRQKAKEAEEATQRPGRHEQAAEPLLRPEQLAALRKELQREAGGAGKGGMPPPTTSARFRRNKAKGPNPLAMKKKAKTTKPRTASAAEAAATAAAVGEGKLAKKRRPEGAGGGSEEAGVGAGSGHGGEAAAMQVQKRRRRRAKQVGAGGSSGGE